MSRYERRRRKEGSEAEDNPFQVNMQVIMSLPRPLLLI
jgi:hypothetical protein